MDGCKMRDQGSWGISQFPESLVTVGSPWRPGHGSALEVRAESEDQLSVLRHSEGHCITIGHFLLAFASQKPRHPQWLPFVLSTLSSSHYFVSRPGLGLT